MTDELVLARTARATKYQLISDDGTWALGHTANILLSLLPLFSLSLCFSIGNAVVQFFKYSLHPSRLLVIMIF